MNIAVRATLRALVTVASLALPLPFLPEQQAGDVILMITDGMVDVTVARMVKGGPD